MMRYQALKVLKSALEKPWQLGGTFSLIWLILECATGQGTVFYLAVLIGYAISCESVNRVLTARLI